MIKLFVYNTLLNPGIQVDIIGRELPGMVDSISGFKVLTDIPFARLVTEDNGIVYGKILEISDDKIGLFDAHESNYVRSKIMTNNGQFVDIYV